jgi:hypothetical protein
MGAKGWFSDQVAGNAWHAEVATGRRHGRAEKKSREVADFLPLSL